MLKRIFLFIAFFSLIVFGSGCDATGSLSEKEEAALMDFLTAEHYIDQKVTLDAEGIGEGELFDYYSNVLVNGKQHVIHIQQAIREEKRRIFEIKIKDSNGDIIEHFYVAIDRESSAVSFEKEL